MKKSPRRQAALLAICAVTMSSTGCYTYEAIKPTELPKVNGAYAKTVGSSVQPNGSTVSVVEKSVVHLERVDGTMVEISGPTDVRVTTKNGTAIDIEHPILARTESDSLFVKGGNVAEQEYELRELQAVEVEKYQQGRTLVLGGALTLGASAMVYMLLGAAGP